MKKFIFILLSIMFIQTMVWAEGETVKLSKNEQKVLNQIQTLEENPIRDDWKDYTTLILRYVINEHKYKVVLENEYLKVGKLDYKYANIISFFYICGSIKFDIFHPSLGNDPEAEKVPGVESMVNAYLTIIKMKPDETNPFLDELVELKQNGQLTIENIKLKFDK